MKTSDQRQKKRLGALIRELRMLRGWTQEELAGKLRECGFGRCKRRLLSQIETGGATIRGHEIYYLRQVYGETFESEFWKPFHKHRARGSKTSKDTLEK